MSKDLLLAIDNGTQSLRALVFDLKGNLVAKTRETFQPYVSPQPRWAEQDPEIYWQALCRACQRLWIEQKVNKDAIAGVAVTTQRGTVVNLDKDGKVLRPAIIWLDQRVAENQPPVKGLMGLAFKVAGVSDTVAYLQANAESNWLRSHQPEIWEKTHKFVLLSGFLNYKLCGRYVDSIGSQIGYFPFNYKKHQWLHDGAWQWDLLGIRKEQLCELFPISSLMGEISAEAADLTGIPKGLPLIAAAGDKGCEILGSGGLNPKVGCLSYGTASTIAITNNKYVEPFPFIPPYPSAVPQNYSMEIQIFRGYWMVEWFKEEFGQAEVARAKEEGVPVEQLLEELLDGVPPGAMGLMLQPYWSPGLKVPGPEARGGVIGWADHHGRGHLYRAILEGLAYALREGKERLERRTKTEMSFLRVSGGGSQSDQAMQLTADIFGLPAQRPHTYETSGLGASIDIAVGMGLHANFETAVKEMTRAGAIFEPIAENVGLYDDLYTHVYLPMYKQLKPIYRRLRKLMQ